MRRLVVLLAACGGSVAHEVENHGRVCLYANDPPRSAQSFVSGAPVYVQYDSTSRVGGFGFCLSSSCTRDLEAMCSVTDNGASLDVTTLARFVDITSEMDGCTADCRYVTALCATPPLESGEHRFTFATQTLTLQIPSDTDAELCMLAKP